MLSKKKEKKKTFTIRKIQCKRKHKCEIVETRKETTEIFNNFG